MSIHSNLASHKRYFSVTEQSWNGWERQCQKIWYFVFAYLQKTIKSLGFIKNLMMNSKYFNGICSNKPYFFVFKIICFSESKSNFHRETYIFLLTICQTINQSAFLHYFLINISFYSNGYFVKWAIKIWTSKRTILFHTVLNEY